MKTHSELSNIEIQQSLIEDIISSLDLNKAVGPDLISHRVLKATQLTISKPLCNLFNKSLNEGEKSCPGNYRPITLLNCLGKLVERCVYKHMYNYNCLIRNTLIYANQSGCLTGHSIVYKLFDLYYQIAKSFDHKTHTGVVFCDIHKAFNRVWHSGIFFKIRQLGIRGNLLTWIENYLSNRQQQVLIGQSHDSRSNEKKVLVFLKGLFSCPCCSSSL